jgi:hypothetical protein
MPMTLDKVDVYSAFASFTEVMLGQRVTYSFVDPERASLLGKAALFAVNGFEDTWEFMWKRGGPMGIVGSVMNGTFDLLECEGDTAVCEAIEEFVGDTLVTPVFAPLRAALFALPIISFGGGASKVIVSTNGGIAQAAGGNGGGSSGGGNGGQTSDQFDDGTYDWDDGSNSGNDYLRPGAALPNTR